MTKSTTPRKSLVPTAALFALSLFALLVSAPAAGAASVGYYSKTGTLYYVSGPGETSNVTVSETPGFYVFSDLTATLTSQYGCTVTALHTATCESKDVRNLYVMTGDGNDTVTVQAATIPIIVDCDEGIDVLYTVDPNTNPRNCESVSPPPSIAPPAPPLSIVEPVTTMTNKGKVPLTVSCSAKAATRCTGTLTFELPAQPVKGKAAASRRGAPNILGRQKLTVQKGKRRRVRISMTGKGRSMVKRTRKLTVVAKLKINVGGKTEVSTQSLTIKAPRLG